MYIGGLRASVTLHRPFGEVDGATLEAPAGRTAAPRLREVLIPADELPDHELEVMEITAVGAADRPPQQGFLGRYVPVHAGPLAQTPRAPPQHAGHCDKRHDAPPKGGFNELLYSIAYPQKKSTVDKSNARTML